MQNSEQNRPQVAEQHSRREFLRFASASILGVGLPSTPNMPEIAFVCSTQNDLYKLIGSPEKRFDSVEDAVMTATVGSGILILADAYPISKTSFTWELLDAAIRKKLRVYIEYPNWVPDQDTPIEKAAALERGVIVSNRFGPRLGPDRIVSINDCHFVKVSATHPDIVLARVAGFDTAVYGLEETEQHPILFESKPDILMVATTKLSAFQTARYGPHDAWLEIWAKILQWLSGNRRVSSPYSLPTVGPSFQRDQVLPHEVERRALQRGIDWFSNAKLLIASSWADQVEIAQTKPDAVAAAPNPAWPAGDGRCGLLEGASSSIDLLGDQPIRWTLRADCIGETSLAFAMSSTIEQDVLHATIAKNLVRFIFETDSLSGGPRSDNSSPSLGLLNWNTTSKGIYYGDDNARCLLGALGTAGALQSAEWDKNILRSILANFRTTGALGFRGERLEEADLQKNGVAYYRQRGITHFAPHFEAYPWCLYLWAYTKTGFEPLLTRTLKAIRSTMNAYPTHWKWTNGIQQERARMILPLAWLLRVKNTQEHRDWLRFMVDELLKYQGPDGAIFEEVGRNGKGMFGPPASNLKYGTTEAPLLQKNGDAVCDLLYTMNFAFLGLHEASATTNEDHYRKAEDRIAEFLCRIQIKSRAHPELDGGWFRAFATNLWDYWASNSDAGWGAWAIESGWTQAWICSVLGLRSKATSLWALAGRSDAGKHMAELQEEFAQSGGI
ncbi:MAG TPA: hypothetical protein VFE38_06835 [Edaphobacter sp.]|nr:hypothetical protein [Edaphobacter sp.]